MRCDEKGGGGRGGGGGGGGAEIAPAPGKGFMEREGEVLATSLVPNPQPLRGMCRVRQTWHMVHNPPQPISPQVTRRLYSLWPVRLQPDPHTQSLPRSSRPRLREKCQPSQLNVLSAIWRLVAK